MKPISETVIKLDSLNLGDVIKYRDEGNMNLVVSISNSSTRFKCDERQVIRFKKVSTHEFGPNIISKDKEKNETEIFIRFEESLKKYLENPEHFTVEPKLAYVDVDLNLLNEFLLCDRPIMRRNKIIGSRYGLLCRDVAFLPCDALLQSHGKYSTFPSTFCIEIKPKQGFILDETIESSVNGIQKCRFCYLQYLKMKDKKIEKISHYCPIDLFSGVPDRMNRAIRGLIDNPQNNLKILMDGKPVYSEYVQDPNALHDILDAIYPDISDFQRKKTSLVNLIRKILMKNFKEQSNIMETFSSNEPAKEHDIHVRSCYMTPRSSLVENSILKSVLKAQELILKNYSILENLQNSNEDGIYAKKVLKDWSAGSTALDCSIMLSFCRIDSNPNNGHCESVYHLKLNFIENLDCQDYLVNATIVDLDFKKDSIAHFMKYKKQLNESKMAFREFINSSPPRHC